jgi:multiple sugar transport system substrate-binding protein
MHRQLKPTLLKILYLLFIAAMLLPAAACSTPTPTPVSFMVFGDPAEFAAYQTLVDAFHEEHPEIAIELINIPSQSDYRKRLAADLAAGTPADVVLINYRRYAAFAVQGSLEPLAPYLAKSDLISEEDFYPQSIEPFTYNGQLMCIPQNLSSLVVYYNKALFDQAGLPYPANDWTWADFQQTAIALTVDNNGDGLNEQFGLGIEPSLIRLTPFIWQAGGEVVDNPTAPTQLALASPEALRAVQFFVDLSVVHHVVPNVEEEAAEESEARFINGTMAMFLNSRRGVPTYREITSFQWDVAPMPQDEQRASILHADAYCLPSASQHKDAAWTFIEYANSPDGQTIIAGTGRTVPSLIAVAESSAFLDPNLAPANSQVFLNELPYIRALPIVPNWADIEEIAGEEIARAFYGQTTVEDAMLAAIGRTVIYFGTGE